MLAVGLATYAASIALLFVGTLYRAPVAVAGVLCMFGLDQLGQVSHPWLLFHQTFSNYAVGALVVLGLIRKRESIAGLLRASPPQTWLIVLLYVYSFASLQWTSMPTVGWSEWMRSAPYIATAALASPLLITSTEDMRLALRWTVFIGVPLTVVILLFAPWGIRGLVVGAVVEETNPLALASFAGTVAAATLFVGLGRKGWLEWLLRLAAVVICVLLIVRSGSRGQLIAVVASLALMLPIRFRLGNIRGLVPAMLACAAIALALDMGSSLYVVNDETRWSSEQASADVTGRFAMVVVLLKEWARSPISILFGLGSSASFDPRLIGIYLHNMPAEVLGELGLIGFTLLLLALGSSAWALIGSRSKALEHPGDAEILAAAGAAAIFSLVLSLKQGSFLNNYQVFMTMLLVVRVAGAIKAGVASVAAVADPAHPSTAQYANLLR
jgi:hypothetical protein